MESMASDPETPHVSCYAITLLAVGESACINSNIHIHTRPDRVSLVGLNRGRLCWHYTLYINLQDT